MDMWESMDIVFLCSGDFKYVSHDHFYYVMYGRADIKYAVKEGIVL